MSGVWFLVRQSTPVMVPASCGVYSGAEPSGLSGSRAMLRSGVSAKPAGAGAPWAAASDIRSAESDNPAIAVAESCMVSRRVMFIGHVLLADIVGNVSVVTARVPVSRPRGQWSIHNAEAE